MRPLFFSILFISTLLSTPASAVTTVGGVKIPDSVELDGEILNLYGVGLRKKLFIKVYAGALYIAGSPGETSLLESTGTSKSMRMHIIHSKIAAKKVRNAWTDGLRNNLTDEKFAAIEARLEQFNNLFPNLHEGDVLEMNFQSGKGTEVVLNGESRGSVEGDDFFSSLLLVWIGDKPADKNLKLGILGGK
jgi:hypothetical protein